jgi:hypothetical protein
VEETLTLCPIVSYFITPASGPIHQTAYLKDDSLNVHGLERKKAIISLNPSAVPLANISQEIVGTSSCQAHLDTKVVARSH